MATVSQSKYDQVRIQALGRELEVVSADVNGNENAKKELLSVVHKAIAMIETPTETIWRLLFVPHVNASIRTAIEMGIVRILNRADTPHTATELAHITDGDELLIVRILRPLAAMNFVIETTFQTYMAGPMCKALAQSGLRGAFKFMHDDSAQTCNKLYEYFRQNGYRNPEGLNGPFQYAQKTDLSMFSSFAQHPEKLTNFLTMLEEYRKGRAFWYDFFPVEELIFKGARIGSKTPLLVDVAGGYGYDIKAFNMRFPGHGPLVLQDLPHVIDDVQGMSSDIIKIEYDFFTPQPIKGAKVYYFRSICHNWSDSKCRELLSNTVAAMQPGYSRLLINDWVLPDTGSTLFPAVMDIQMMTMFSGMERTVSQWKKLLDSVGLKTVKFWASSKEVEGLIETMLQ